MKEPVQLDLVDWIEEHSKMEEIMAPTMRKIDEFEGSSYRQKDGCPRNISEIIRGHNLLVDAVNWLIKKNEELELVIQDLKQTRGGKDA